jgi:hypothetical protein
MLARKYRSDQPRAPAGQPDGGRWVSAPSGGARWMSANSGGQAETQTEEAVTEDGSRVLSIRIRANARADWDAQHTVTAPDGTRTVFETSGLTQTIRDGETGEILGRSTLTADGAESEAFVQPARGLPGKLGQRIWRTLEAAGTLFSVLAGRDRDGERAVFAAPASEYVLGDAEDARAIWVGAIGQIELDQICPRNREVQALADSVAAEVRASGDFRTAQDFGNKVHARIAKNVNGRKDPNFVAETSYDPATGVDQNSGAKGSLRLDLLERTQLSTVCVYDHKTGNADLRPTCANDTISAVQKRFGLCYRYIMIMIKPKL